MQVNGKYLKDEQNEIISPIVSTDTVYLNDIKLSQLLDLERTETVVGTYEEEGYLYAKNIVIQITPGNRVGYTVSNSDIDIKYKIFYRKVFLYCRLSIYITLL